MKIGLFGGAFDPIHNGHLSMIVGAIDAGIDLVVVIPSARSAFKRGHSISAAPYRYYMTETAINGLKPSYRDKVLLSDVEYKLPGISYTYNTINALIDDGILEESLNKQAKNSIYNRYIKEQNEFFWICGSDILDSFDKWYKPGEILKRAKLMVANRPGDCDNEDFVQKSKSVSERFDTEIVFFKIKGLEAASSDIRMNNNFDSVPSEVRKFIETHALYKDEHILDFCSESAVTAFYEYAIDLFFVLSSKRLLHTLNVAIYAAKLAKLHSANTDKALIAGVLHDCAKELPIEVQHEYAVIKSGGLFDNEKLYHSPAGAYVAENRYRIKDEEILNAILYHTTGHGGMTDVEKIVFISDKLEPARTYSDLTEMRAAALSNLNEAMKMVTEEIYEKFVARHQGIHPLTNAMMKDFL